MTSSIQKMMTTLDTHKESLCDGVYLELSNDLKIIYEENKRNEEEGGEEQLEILRRNIYTKAMKIEHLEIQIECMRKMDDKLWEYKLELQNKLYKECECGQEVLRSNFGRHKKTKRCVKWHEENLRN